MLNFCPICGSKLCGGKFCPNCGTDLAQFDNGTSSADSQVTLHDAISANQGNTAYSSQNFNTKLRSYIIRGKIDDAKQLCDELIDSDPLNKDGYIGLIRIVSDNYRIYDSAEVAKYIKIAEEIFSGSSELFSDVEYANYITARKQFLVDENQKKQAALKAERDIIMQQLDLKNNADGTYTVCGVKDKSVARIIIPYGVTSIDESAFKECNNLTSVIFESACADGVANVQGETNTISDCKLIEIGEHAFFNCINLIDINIPDSVISIGDCAFRGCSGLTMVNLPNSLKSIGYCAFYECSGLTSVNLPNSLTSIGKHAFRGCSGLTSINLPNSLTSIGDYAFSDCSSLLSVDLPNSLTSIGEFAFADCKSLISIRIPNSVEFIWDGAFWGCESLLNIKMPNNITIIHSNTFHDCISLTSVIIPDSVTGIRTEAFSGCRRLAYIIIPISVERIEERAFRGCKNLTIYCEADGEYTGWSGDWNNVSVDDSVFAEGEYCNVVWDYKK